MSKNPRQSDVLKTGITACVLLFLSFSFCSLNAQNVPAINHENWKSGAVFYDKNKWTEVIVGDIPLVISVPHGGLLHDEAIPDRDCRDVGRVVKGVDSRTIETARAIDSAFRMHFNKRPYIIISHLSRRKVDQNRDVDLATCGNELGIQAWDFFHQSIDSAIAHAGMQFDQIIFIDLHGHGHKNQRLELGYGLTKQALQDAYQGKQVENLARQSSLQNILEVPIATCFREELFGPTGFGSLIYQQGVPATPSMQDPHPVNDEPFWSGGYNTRRYTSAAYPTVYGWQIEAHYRGARDTENNRNTFAIAFLKAYKKYSENK